MHWVLFHNALVLWMVQNIYLMSLSIGIFLCSLTWQSLVLAGLGSILTFALVVPRLLGLFISKIVLRLITNGFQISVNKIAFLQLIGIRVFIPESGICIRVEEISLATKFHNVTCIAKRSKFFVLLVRRPRLEVDLANAIKASNASNAQGQDSRVGSKSATTPGAHAAVLQTAVPPSTTPPGWLDRLKKRAQDSVLPPILDLILRSASASIEMMVMDSTAEVAVPMMGQLCLSLLELALTLERTTAAATTAGAKKKPAMAISVATHRACLWQQVIHTYTHTHTQTATL